MFCSPCHLLLLSSSWQALVPCWVHHSLRGLPHVSCSLARERTEFANLCVCLPGPTTTSTLTGVSLCASTRTPRASTAATTTTTTARRSSRRRPRVRLGMGTPTTTRLPASFALSTCSNVCQGFSFDLFPCSMHFQSSPFSLLSLVACLPTRACQHTCIHSLHASLTLSPFRVFPLH
jgi:hypothetical protein